MLKLENFKSMDGYTFEEGVAFLRLCRAPNGVIHHIASTHNRSHLHSEIHKALRIPGTMRLLREKGIGREKEENVAFVPEPAPDPDPEGTPDDSTEIVLTVEDVRTHVNTRLEDMPNELCRKLWLKRQEVYREMQQAHLKMRSVPEGEEHNAERAHYRACVLRLDAENDEYWKQIDAEIERDRHNNERADKVVIDNAGKPGFDVSTYRAYISRALRKKELTPAQLAELQHRVDAMLAARVEIMTDTLEKLKAKGVSVG